MGTSAMGREGGGFLRMGAFFTAVCWRLVVSLQAFLLAWLSPAQWFFFGSLNLSRANVVWTIMGPVADHQPEDESEVKDEEEMKDEARLRRRNRGMLLSWEAGGGGVDRLHQLLETLKAMEVEGLRVEGTWCNARGGGLRAQYRTPVLKWVEVITIDLHRTQGEAVVADVWSWSTSLFPATMPFAPLLSVLFWWIPFDDHYHNYHNCREVRRFLTSKGYLVEEDIVVRGFCVFPFDFKMGASSSKWGTGRKEEKPVEAQ